ncbi:MAG: hypothetical protein JST20_08145 [Bacteroidetes bacterium]|nr:hypothetical protein [Bacteroidota bacterium]
MKFSTILSLITIISIVITNSVYSQKSVHIHPNTSGVRISLRGLQATIKSNLDSSGTSAWITNSRYTIPLQKGNDAALQKLRISIAIPPSTEITPLLHNYRSRNVATTSIARVSALKDFSSNTNPMIFLPSFEVKPSVILRKIGIQRGVIIADIEIQPFQYSSKTGELSILDSAEIDIPFGRSIPNSTEELTKVENGLFSGIENASQIPALRRIKLLEDAKAPRPLNSIDSINTWYNPKTTYLRIATNSDGVARLQANTILESAPEWKGLTTNGLHLLYKGKEYPFGSNDFNDIIDQNDEYYFAGRRTIGDSTWQNCITPDAVFYLYYDATISGKRLAQFPDVTPTTTDIQSVFINKHIEEDHLYFWGDNDPNDSRLSQYKCDILNNEGFYWVNLNNSIFEYYKTFNYPILLAPSELTGDMLTAKAFFHTTTKNFTSVPNYNVISSINSTEQSKNPIDGISNANSEFTIESSQFLGGINNFSIKSDTVSNNMNGTARTGDLLIDYIILSGKVKPFAENGKADFKTENLAQPSKLNIRGFRSSQVVIIDTILSLFTIKTGTQGTTIRSGGIGEQTPRLSIVINDSVVVSVDSSALFVSIVDAPSFSTIRLKRFDQAGNGLRAFIDTSPSESIITAVSNFPTISQEIKQVFGGLGSQEINKLSTNTTWTGVFQKGNNSIRKEKSGAVSSLAEFIPHIGGKAYQADIALRAGNSYSLQSADLLSAEIPSVSREPLSNLHDTTQQFDAIIITHSKFKESANRLAKHRASQGWKMTVVTVEDIYKEFYGGEKSPHAIKAFLRYVYNHWQKPTPAYLTMFGDASWDPRKFEYNSVETDYVPSYGYPVSDFWFTLLDGNDLIPEMAVGRLPVRSIVEANDMVDKLIEYDSLPAAPWKKKFLFLSGGSGTEGVKFYNKFYDFADYLLFYPICGDTTRIRGDLGVEFAKPTTIRSAINDGALWLSFFGHSAPTIFDLDGWAVEDLNNRGRYNVLATYSCNSGAYANPYGIARNESYVITPHKGSIASFGSTFIGYVDDDAALQYSFHKNMANDTVRLLGDILNKAKRGWERDLENTLMQYSLIGDPLTRLTLDNKPDLYAMPQEVIITSTTDDPLISEIDSVVKATFTIRTAGLGNRQEIPLLLIHSYPGGIDSTQMTISELCNHEKLNTFLIVRNHPGTHTFTINIDPEGTINETQRSNNSTTVSFEVFSAGLAALDPLPFWDVDAQSPTFRLVLPQKIAQAEYEFMLQATNGDTVIYINTDKPSQELTLHEAYIEWLPNINLMNGNSYTFSARVKNEITGKLSAWLHIPFHAVSSQTEYTAQWKQQSHQEILTNALRDIIVEKKVDSTYQLRLNTYSVPVSVVSNNGNSYAKIKIGEAEPISFNIYTRFNLVHLTPSDTNFKYFDYETFSPSGRSGSAEDMVRYLRDSVAWGDVIVLAPGGASFNSFFVHYQPDSIGSMKSLTETLKKQYGASLIDSIYLRTHYPDGTPIDSVYYIATGYALIARKDSLPHPIKEAYSYWKDTVTIEDTIQFYSYSGEIASPIIGPASVWDSVKIISDIPLKSSKKIDIYGKESSSATEKLLKTDSVTTISLREVDAKLYPYLSIKTSLNRTSYLVEPIISGFECIYKPTVEYAILPSKTSIIVDNVLRGDTSLFNYGLMNIAKRGLPDTSEVATTIYPEQGSGRTFTYYHPLPKLLSEETIGFTDTILSKEFATTSRIQPEIDGQNKLHEIYRFNNKSATFYHVREDSIKPKIEFRVDGVLVKDYDFVAPEPLFEIIIHDNSNLAIDSAKIRIRLNRFIQPDTTSINAKFETIQGQGDTRARLSFITKRLEEENIIQITVEDASNNKDTLKIRLNIAKNASIENLFAIPTPTDNETTLSFTYIGQNQDSPATVDIFSLSGQAIRSLKSNVRIGHNSVHWDGNDNYGSRVAPGIYVYRLNVQAQLYSDPLFGKIMITR